MKYKHKGKKILGGDWLNTKTIDAPAKINLSLDVVRRRENGYHELSMIMQELALKDRVTITTADHELLNNDKQPFLDIEITCDHTDVPLDETNIVWKAVKLMSEQYDVKKQVKIHIEKHIPLSGGMGGGSTDAAAVLKGLNELWELGLTDDKLCELGLQLGADVPFFIQGGTAHAEGIGEKLTQLPSFKDRLILIANPGFVVSTKDVYQNLKLDGLKDRPYMNKIIQYIELGDTKRLSYNMRNVLESVTIPMHIEIAHIKKKMIDCGALGSLMSGSGASVFGIFECEEQLKECERELKKTIDLVIPTCTI